MESQRFASKRLPASNNLSDLGELEERAILDSNQWPSAPEIAIGPKTHVSRGDVSPRGNGDSENNSGNLDDGPGPAACPISSKLRAEKSTFLPSRTVEITVEENAKLELATVALKSRGDPVSPRSPRQDPSWARAFRGQ